MGYVYDVVVIFYKFRQSFCLFDRIRLRLCDHTLILLEERHTDH